MKLVDLAALLWIFAVLGVIFLGPFVVLALIIKFLTQ